jgi:hypothetical protein
MGTPREIRLVRDQQVAHVMADHHDGVDAAAGDQECLAFRHRLLDEREFRASARALIPFQGF